MRHTFARIVGVALVLCGFAALASPACAGKKASADGVLDVIQKAWNDRDADALLDCYSDVAVIVTDPGKSASGAIIEGQDAFIRGVAHTLKKGTSPTRRLLTNRRIDLRPPLAFIFLTVQDTWDDGSATTSERLCIAYHETGSYEMVVDVPRCYRPVALVTDVEPGGQGKQIGLKKGDLITGYGDQSIVDADQFERAIEAHAGKKGKKLLVLVERGGESVELLATPGALDAAVETRLVGNADAQTLGADDKSLILQAAVRLAEADCQQDAKNFLAEMSDDAFVLFLPVVQPGYLQATMTVTTPDAAAANLKNCWQVTRTVVAPGTIRCDRVDAIVKADVAVVCIRFARKTPEGAAGSMVNTYVFARNNGEWKAVCNLPMRLGIGLGG